MRSLLILTLFASVAQAQAQTETKACAYNVGEKVVTCRVAAASCSCGWTDGVAAPKFVEEELVLPSYVVSAQKRAKICVNDFPNDPKLKRWCIDQVTDAFMRKMAEDNKQVFYPGEHQ